MLTKALGSPENGEIILITDGENNKGNLSLSRQNAINAKIKVTTIAVSQQADTLLSDIAMETGGKHFTYLELDTISLAAVFDAAISGGGFVTKAASQPVMVENDTFIQ
jgi:hypothetical protein